MAPRECGVRLVISDAHKGLTAALRKVLKAEWQRCKVHFYRNVLAQVPHWRVARSWPLLELSGQR